MVSVSIFAGDPTEAIRLILFLFWQPVGAFNSGLITIGNGYVNIPTLLDGETLTWKASIGGAQSITYVGESLIHQF